MITDSYVSELYLFAKTILGAAERDNLRSTCYDWIHDEIGNDTFHNDICRALAVDSGASEYNSIFA